MNRLFTAGCIALACSCIQTESHDAHCGACDGVIQMIVDARDDKHIIDIDWRDLSDDGIVFLRGMIHPIAASPECLSKVCLWLDHYDQIYGNNETHYAWFLHRLRWHIIIAICNCNSSQAYTEFKKCQDKMGYDGGESLLFEELEAKFFPDRTSGAVREKVLSP